MTDIQFNEEQEFNRPAEVPQQSVFIRLALKTGLVKTEQGANYLLLGVAIVGILFTLFMMFSSGGSSKPPVPSITGIPIRTP
jgi:hypothetical protein